MQTENGYLHFEDNEVSVLNKDGETIERKTFGSAQEAHEFFANEVAQIAIDETKWQEWESYTPKFPPQRLRFGTRAGVIGENG